MSYSFYGVHDVVDYRNLRPNSAIDTALDTYYAIQRAKNSSPASRDVGDIYKWSESLNKQREEAVRLLERQIEELQNVRSALVCIKKAIK